MERKIMKVSVDFIIWDIEFIILSQINWRERSTIDSGKL